MSAKDGGLKKRRSEKLQKGRNISKQRGHRRFKDEGVDNFRKKRKWTHATDTQPKQKKTKTDSFTEIDFKVLLRDPNSLNSGLEKFIESSEKSSVGKGEYDIVEGFCRSSPECAEITHLLDGEKRKLPELQLIFSCLEKILLRIASDLPNYTSVGIKVMKKLLPLHVHSFYFTLKADNRSSQIKTTVKLLVAMVMLGDTAARWVLNHFDFGHNCVKPLFSRRDVKDEEDVRTCMIHFALGILLTDKSDIIRQTLDKKGLLAYVFEGMVYDRVPTVQIILNTVLEKIVTNQYVSVTSKLHTFTDKCLKQLGLLYNWKGPAKWKESMRGFNKRSHSKIKKVEEVGETEEHSEDRQQVSEGVHKFLLELCTSDKHRIFCSGQPQGKAESQTLSSFLQYLSTVCQHSLVQDLVVRVLTICPEQLHGFVTKIAHMLSPRLAPKWVQSVHFLCKIYDSMPITSAVDACDSSKPVIEAVHTLIQYTLPPPQVLTAVLSGLKEKSLAINHVTVAVVKQIGECAARAVEVVKSSTKTSFSEENIADIVHLYKDAIVKAMPNAQALFAYWDKIQLHLTDKIDKAELEQLKDLCHADICGVLVRAEQVLCLYQALTPTLLVNHSFALGKLLDGILNKDLSSYDLSPDSHYLPQMYLLKLLAGTDAGRLPFGKQNSAHHTLMYQLLEMVPQACNQPKMKQATVQLLCQLLQNTGAFESCYDELMVWMTRLQNYDPRSEASSAILDFAAKVILRYMGNPFPYMDKVCDLVSEVTVMETKKGEATSLERKLADILHEEMVDVEVVECSVSEDFSKEALKRFPFCPMLLVAVETIEKMEDVHPELKGYLSSVLLDTFHLQVDPLPLCMLTKSFSAKLFVDDILEYIALWLPEVKSPNTSKMLSKMSQKTSSVMTGNDGTLVTMDKLSNLRMNLGSMDVDSMTVIQENLLHITYLTGHGHDDRQRNKLQEVINTIEKTIQQIVLTKEEGIADEISPLNVQKLSHREMAVKAINLVLNHPKVRQYFHADILKIDGMQNTVAAECLTTLAVKILITVHENGLAIGNCIEYFQCRILDCLKILPTLKERHQVLQHLYYVLQYIVEGLSCKKCVQVLDSVLSLTAVRNEVVEGFCAVTNTLLRRLMTSEKNEIRMSSSGAKQLIACYSKQSEGGASDVLVEFFTKLPNFAVFVDPLDLEIILKPSFDVRLTQVLITHNVTLRDKLGEMILTKVSCIHPDKHLPLMKTYLELMSTTDQSNKRDIQKKMVEFYETDLLDLCGVAVTEPRELLVQFCQHLIELQALGSKTLKKMEKKLLTAVSDTDTVQTHHIELIEAILMVKSKTNSEGQPISDEENRYRMLLIGVQTLAKLLKKKKRHQTTENKLLGILACFSSSEMEGLRTIGDVWSKFLKYTLKHCYTDPRLLKFLVKAVPIMYQGQSEDTQVSIETAVAMVMSHSSFFTVMFNEESEDCKEALLDLLLVLIELSPTSCSTEHLGVLLGAYSGTLSLTDQKILNLLQLYEQNGVHFIEFKPFLWGEKAIEYQQMGKTGQTLHRQPGMGQVIANLDKDRMGNTIVNFPILRKLQSTTVEVAEKYKSKPTCYDPGFLLPLLSHLLSSDSVVNSKKFIESDCMGLTLAALTSHDEMMRSAAYHVLDRFKLHLEGARFAEKDQILHLLDLLHNSVGKSKFKLPSIAAMFLAKTVQLLLKPGTHMYGVINAFLMHKPKLDVQEVPEFYKLFNSSAWEYKAERMWILCLMCDGLREKEEYKIFEKRYIFKLLQGFYQSTLADQGCQIKVLEIVHRACSEHSVASTLVSKHSLMAWISTVVTELSPNSNHQVELLVNIMSTLWHSLVDHGNSQVKGHSVKQVLFRQILSILQSLLWLARGCSLQSLLQLARTLQSVLRYTESSATLGKIGPGSVAPPTLSYPDALVLLYHCGRYIPSKINPNSILNILKSLGYSTDQLEFKGDHLGFVADLQDKNTEELDTTHSKKNGQEENKDSAEDMVESPNMSKDNVNKSDTTKTEVVKEIDETIAEMLLTMNPLTAIDGVEVTAACMVQITWLVEHINKLELLKPEIVVKLLETVKDTVLGNKESLVLELLASESDLSSYVVSALLNMYTVVMETMQNTSQPGGDGCSGNVIMESLNMILFALALRRLAETEKEQHQISECLLTNLATGADVEHQSVILRRLYLSSCPASVDKDLLLSQKASRRGDNSKSIKGNNDMVKDSNGNSVENIGTSKQNRREGDSESSVDDNDSSDSDIDSVDDSVGDDEYEDTSEMEVSN